MLPPSTPDSPPPALPTVPSGQGVRSAASTSLVLWDVFCRVIDNFGDIGVCWRLCADLAARGHQVRLWVDDSSALDWMAPGARQGAWPGVSVYDWQQSRDAHLLATLPAADGWIEGFGCEIAMEFIAAHAVSMRSRAQKHSQSPVWINLEYLSAQAYAARCHGLPSPVMHGPAQGWTKYFYYPGFQPDTGGLLREPDYSARHSNWSDATRRAWLARQGVAWQGERVISLFCYEPAVLPDALHAWIHADTPTLLLVTPGRASAAVHAALQHLPGGYDTDLPPPTQHDDGSTTHGALRIQPLPALPQTEFDALLNCCDLNLVRGEDSLVRAIWAGKAFIWQIYPQDDAAHGPKLHAFLDALDAPATLRMAHAHWNNLCALGTMDWDALPLPNWRDAIVALRERLHRQADLVSALVDFAEKKR